ncbi:STAS domain-containing protein [Streptomyces europaeiscabiei]|uniref:STAS domain-containing protein n=1 Tax=Streptomyces TaxID=1883 RepID=UPI000A361643|nr:MULTISPECIES: STAS domain-containing protein [Streptomyces]MDX3637110.1 STAS domain-containing protein [Streptomyces europaeiscabiei]MDX3655254.1 STAS domain-containing protein [Streptomyces europaeiscabiei]
MSKTHTRSVPHLMEQPARGSTVLELRGEIDLATVPSLSARLDTLTAHGQPDLILDLRRVSFIDCAGLGVLCRVRNRTLARQGRLRLVSDSGRFLRVLRHAGLSGAFEVHPPARGDDAHDSGGLTGPTRSAAPPRTPDPGRAEG